MNSRQNVIHVLDVQMPGLNGIKLQERLENAGNALRIVFISSHGDIPTSVRVTKAGAEDFLTKPISKCLSGNKLNSLNQL